MRLLVLLLTPAVFAQSSGALFTQTFEHDTAGWTVMGQGGNVRATDGVLAFTSEAKPKQISAVVIPAPAALSRMQRLRFRIKSDRQTALAVLLAEKKPGGGNYTAWVWSPANVWQDVELTPADFSVSDGPNDPVDADGKLDLDAVQGVGVLDLAPFFANLPRRGDIPLAVEEVSGPRTISIERFEILGTPGGTIAPIDRFERDYLAWATPGGMKLGLSAKDNPLGERALVASYRQSETELALLLRRVTAMNLSASTKLTFDIASEREATLVVSLETKGGQRYSMQIFPPGGREVFHVSLKLADFEGPGKIDPAQLKILSLVDITAAGGGGEAANTIWVGKVEAP